MTYEQPSIPENQNENLEELNNEEQEKLPIKPIPIERVNLNQEDLDELKRLENEVKYEKNKKNKDEVKLFNNAGFIPVAEKKGHNVLRRFTAGVLGLATMLGFTQKASAGTSTPEDSLGKKTLTEKINPSDSTEKSTTNKDYEQKAINEKIGHVTIEGSIFIPQKDTSKEVYVYYYSDDGKSENSLAEILNAMKQKGLRPADRNLLEEVYNQNKDDEQFNKKTKWIMAPTPESDADDTRQNEKYMVTKNGKTQFVLPEHAVFPTKSPNGLGRFEIDQGFDPKEYGLMFYKQIEKNNTASYESGLVKNK